MKNFMKKFWQEEDGIETLEVLLIVAIIVVIAVLFKDNITKWAGDLIDKGQSNVDDVLAD